MSQADGSEHVGASTTHSAELIQQAFRHEASSPRLSGLEQHAQIGSNEDDLAQSRSQSEKEQHDESREHKEQPNEADLLSRGIGNVQIDGDRQEHAEDKLASEPASKASPGVYDGIEALGRKGAQSPTKDGATPMPNDIKSETQGDIATEAIDPPDETKQELPSESAEAYDDTTVPNKQAVAENWDNDSRSEIQSIMDQFETQGEEEDAMSEEPAQESQSAIHPPRQSSLEPQHSGSPQSGKARSFQPLNSPIRPPSLRSFSQVGVSNPNVAPSPKSPALNKALPPAPDPEPNLPFDFHRFLEQLRHRTADSVAKYLRSFLQEFGKKQWMVHEQVKIISDFLVFIANKMAQCEIWRDVSDAEFDNAREGMEKLVMNRLYSQTFSPAIAPPPPTSPQRGRRNAPRQQGPGRRGQHQEDVERDEVLAQKVRIYGWVREEHLDIAPVGKTGQRFLSRAQQELLKITSYRAPRDKVICVLNCCKVIFGFLKTSKDSDTSADAFVPLLIYVILRANPEHLVSNVQYISRFRNPDKLGGEAGYYLSSLMGAVQFIESLDRTALTISNEEFEKNVEAAVSAIAERKSFESQPAELPGNARLQPPGDPEKAQHMPRSSSAQPRVAMGISSSSAGGDETPVGGLLKTIQKPLSSIGRIFSEDAASEGQERPAHRSTNSMDGGRRLSPAVFQPPRRSSDTGPTANPEATDGSSGSHAASPAARAASSEEVQARRIRNAEYRNIVETLVAMFPNLDRDVIADVVRMKEGRVGSAVDACLALNG